MTAIERQKETKTYQTIKRQPADLRAMFGREPDNVATAAELLSHAKRIFTIGIGSSHHASQVGAWLLRSARRDAVAVNAFDIHSYPELYSVGAGDMAVIFGHTGSTSITRKVLDFLIAHSVPIVAVGSTKAEHPGANIVLRTTEREKSATYTSSHLCAMAAMAQVATALGNTDLESALLALPDQITDVLSREGEIWPISEKAVTKRIYAYGVGPNEVTATELMIKVREAAYHSIDGLAAEQFLHGPTISFNKGDLAVAIVVPGPGAERVGAIARVNAAMGGDVWTVGTRIADLTSDHFALPELPEVLSPLLAVVPMQLLASQMSAIKQTNPDQFRMDDPLYDAVFRKIGF